MKLFKDMSYKKVIIIGLLFIPVTVWDVFFFLIEKFYAGCKVIDKKGEEILTNLTDRF